MNSTYLDSKSVNIIFAIDYIEKPMTNIINLADFFGCNWNVGVSSNHLQECKKLYNLSKLMK